MPIPPPASRPPFCRISQPSFSCSIHPLLSHYLHSGSPIPKPKVPIPPSHVKFMAMMRIVWERVTCRGLREGSVLRLEGGQGPSPTIPISAPLPQALISYPMSTPSRLAQPVSALPYNYVLPFTGSSPPCNVLPSPVSSPPYPCAPLSPPPPLYSPIPT